MTADSFHQSVKLMWSSGLVLIINEMLSAFTGFTTCIKFGPDICCAEQRRHRMWPRFSDHHLSHEDLFLFILTCFGLDDDDHQAKCINQLRARIFVGTVCGMHHCVNPAVSVGSLSRGDTVVLVHVYCPALVYASSSHSIIKKRDETFNNDDFIDMISV